MGDGWMMMVHSLLLRSWSESSPGALCGRLGGALSLGLEISGWNKCESK